MSWWQRALIVIGVYALMAALFGALCYKAPMDPDDPNTRDDEK